MKKVETKERKKINKKRKTLPGKCLKRNCSYDVQIARPELLMKQKTSKQL